MRALGLKPGEAADHATLQNMQHLQEAFTFFFGKGSAAERYYEDEAGFNSVVTAASSLQNAQWYIGGNAALMAQKISSTFPETEVMLVGPVGPKLLSLLHTSVKVPEKALIDEDEVHLIMEYQKNEIWGGRSAPVANRFITSHDESNSHLLMQHAFFDTLASWDPDLIVLAGLHLLDGHEESLWQKKLQGLREHLKTLPTSTPIHLEVASMADRNFTAQVVTQLFPFVDSIGCNEQELAFLSHAAGGPHASMYVEGVAVQPDLDKVVDIMHWLLTSLGDRLSRVHYHSLTYHVIGVRTDRWNNTRQAIAAGARVAGQQACMQLELTPDIVELRMPRDVRFGDDASLTYDPTQPAVGWQRGDVSYYFSPVLICKEPLRTVGLGDAISSTALIYSEFVR
ncbi:PREDICTED: ADP-dependent glucokinase-like isoform X2 [Priapulus caudatus]|uniref:ADP-dependent glucokinase-like isoform X2 n=1 Tax=Priapulus caudatus TaxID=37621 RepID=A0ABM1DYB4_PRICU|nr:PREDICTED: ADP-dependent glucokinase-like isoform X2 [Priapulus caudatus]